MSLGSLDVALQGKDNDQSLATIYRLTNGFELYENKIISIYWVLSHKWCSEYKTPSNEPSVSILEIISLLGPTTSLADRVRPESLSCCTTLT